MPNIEKAGQPKVTKALPETVDAIRDEIKQIRDWAVWVNQRIIEGGGQQGGAPTYPPG